MTDREQRLPVRRRILLAAACAIPGLIAAWVVLVGICRFAALGLPGDGGWTQAMHDASVAFAFLIAWAVLVVCIVTFPAIWSNE